MSPEIQLTDGNFKLFADIFYEQRASFYLVGHISDTLIHI